MRNLICWLFGHVPGHISYWNMTAVCRRCGAKLDVSYDMYSGETVVVGGGLREYWRRHRGRKK